jgi:hypothetical protein
MGGDFLKPSRSQLLSPACPEISAWIAGYYPGIETRTRKMRCSEGRSAGGTAGLIAKGRIGRESVVAALEIELRRIKLRRAGVAEVLLSRWRWRSREARSRLTKESTSANCDTRAEGYATDDDQRCRQSATILHVKFPRNRLV